MLMFVLSSTTPGTLLAVLAFGLLESLSVPVHESQRLEPTESSVQMSGLTTVRPEKSWRQISIQRNTPSAQEHSLHMDLGIPPKQKRNRRQAFADALRALLSDGC